jgi:hypothetical protein
MTYAFPEDELRPVTCGPLTRDRENPAHIELNDVLGNYSLTLIDSLSTLAIIASSPLTDNYTRDPLGDFQNGVKMLVELYGDGSPGADGQGTRARGFDFDSKVQVFETTIRGVGGLLSAHLFATGDLPIRGYNPVRHAGHKNDPKHKHVVPAIAWPNGLEYNGQLLRLARDLADRLLPAFYSATGLPYPRVNLRYGIPFYTNAPHYYEDYQGQCQPDHPGVQEITETCSAGAGSLVLEFATLSRLTGDPHYEEVATRAFWSVWDKRSNIDLLGAGIDAETGEWVAPFAGIGAGIDSFFEYAFKSHILLSGSAPDYPVNVTASEWDYLLVWLDAHAGIKRHLYRDSAFQHPHYIQGDLNTGAVRAYWIDSLSAYYPGLLALAGEVEEAIQTHLLYTALWSRYASLPERWSTATGNIESGLKWWGGRPEFIESTWYLYRATEDPWYLHVGEMTLSDIKRRCWTACGWAGLEDVRTGELKDRMESFFLGETVKYLYLLFDSDHPLNTLDAPFVFTTEGHPLIIPESTRKTRNRNRDPPVDKELSEMTLTSQCPAPAAPQPFSISSVASRPELFHAASLARLHVVPVFGQPSTLDSGHDHLSLADTIAASPNNYTFYPWTLPQIYIPAKGFSSKLETRITFDLTFPPPKTPNTSPLRVDRLDEGVMISTVAGLRLSLIRQRDWLSDLNVFHEYFRVSAISQLGLGRDEKVFIPLEAVAELNPTDPFFTKRRDLTMVDLVIDEGGQVDTPPSESTPSDPIDLNVTATLDLDSVIANAQAATLNMNVADQGFLSMLMQHFSSAFEQGQFPFTALVNGGEKPSPSTASTPTTRKVVPASIATGIGAGLIPDLPDAAITLSADTANDHLSLQNIFMSDETCEQPLEASVPRKHQVIVMKRGGCSFSEKLRNIPSFAPSAMSLQLVIIVDFEDSSSQAKRHDGQKSHTQESKRNLIRPLLDVMQRTPSGVTRLNQIPMVMVEGGQETWMALRTARSVGTRRRYRYECQGLGIGNLVIV